MDCRSGLQGSLGFKVDDYVSCIVSEVLLIR